MSRPLFEDPDASESDADVDEDDCDEEIEEDNMREQRTTIHSYEYFKAVSAR